MNDPWDVFVVGSCMIDLVSYAPRIPQTGETLKGSDFSIGFGGKGGNQCIAAKKLGARSVLLSRVGDDSFGRDYIKHLQKMDISLEHIRVTKGMTSGMAQIIVAPNGDNQIVIVPGANNKISERDLTMAENEIVNSKVMLCQMEINYESTMRALEMKARSGIGITILNAAPASSDMNPSLFTLPDIFCVNETEAEVYTAIKIWSLEDAKRALRKLIGRGCREVIITLGDEGAIYGSNSSSETVHVPAQKVKTVDTTGAGDSFLGALGYYLAKYPEISMQEKIKRACCAAAISVQRRGTQESFPSIAELNSGTIQI